jgi:hypothetical protein
VPIFTINARNAASELFKLNSEVYVNQIAESLRVAQNALAERANKQLKQDAVDFSDPRIARPQAERDKLAREKAAFVDEATLMATVMSKLAWIDTTLNDIKTQLLSLGPASTAAEREAAAAALDEGLRKINGYANSAGDYGKNPIGKPQNAAFKTADVVSASATGGVYIKGKFQGAEFQITDQDGKIWRVDRETNELVQYDSWPDQETGTRFDIETLSVTSYDEQTGAITLDTPDGPLTGTLERFGVGMLDSFLYNGLADDADVARALGDVEAALARFAIDKAVFGGGNVALAGRLDQLNKRIADIDKRISDVTKEMITERTAADKALKTKVLLQQQALSLTVGSQGAMVDLFFRGTIKTGTIFDRTNRSS